MNRVTITHVGRSGVLDQDGTYRNYYSVEHQDGKPLDIRALQEHATGAYTYRSRAPGAEYCARAVVYPHPYLKYRAIIETETALDI